MLSRGRRNSIHVGTASCCVLVIQQHLTIQRYVSRRLVVRRGYKTFFRPAAVCCSPEDVVLGLVSNIENFTTVACPEETLFPLLCLRQPGEKFSLPVVDPHIT